VTRTLSVTTGGPPEKSIGNDDMSFSPNDELLLRDETLWDLRISGNVPVQRFDRFSEAAGACFHPAGNEIIIGREVWDIRSSRLLRTVPSLNRAALKFNNDGTVGLAHIRHQFDEPALTALRRCHHPYKHSFCTIDMTDYSDICTVDVDRGMIDAAWDMNTDTLCATVEYDIMDTHESIIRIFEVGRLRPTEDESDVEDEDGRHGDFFDDDDGMDYDSEDYYDDEDDDDDDGRRGDRPINIDERRVARTAADGLRTLLGRGDNVNDDWARYDEYSSDYDSDYGSSEDYDDEDSIDEMYESDYFGVAPAGNRGRRDRGARDVRIRIGDPNGDFNIDLARQPRRRRQRAHEDDEEDEEEHDEDGGSSDDEDEDDGSSDSYSDSESYEDSGSTGTDASDDDDDDDDDDASEWETDTDTPTGSGDWADDADRGAEFGTD
jgi:HIV-1 Vpr-binding protein